MWNHRLFRSVVSQLSLARSAKCVPQTGSIVLHLTSGTRAPPSGTRRGGLTKWSAAMFPERFVPVLKHPANEGTSSVGPDAAEARGVVSVHEFHPQTRNAGREHGDCEHRSRSIRRRFHRPNSFLMRIESTSMKHIIALFLIRIHAKYADTRAVKEQRFAETMPAFRHPGQTRLLPPAIPRRQSVGSSYSAVIISEMLITTTLRARPEKS